jgi:hypothetical protein
MASPYKPLPLRIVRQAAKRLLTYIVPEVADFPARLDAIEAAFGQLAESPCYEDGESSLNGQRARRRIVMEVLEKTRPEFVVETGTFLGNTTGWFATSGNVTVYSCEISRPLHYVAKQRLRKFPNVMLSLCDSRTLLTSLKDAGVCRNVTFFYLDAHWLVDLPLLDEIEIIASSWPDFVILIDDFKVPDDDGYGYDRYGKATLNYSYISDIVQKYAIDVYFPTVASAIETGLKRGYVFLARGKRSTLAQVEGLAQFVRC